MPCAAWGQNLLVQTQSVLTRQPPHLFHVQSQIPGLQEIIYSQSYTSVKNGEAALCWCLLSEFDLELLTLASEKNLCFAGKKCRAGCFPGVVFTSKPRTRGCFSVRSALWRSAEVHSSSGTTFQDISSTPNKLPVLSIKEVIFCDTSFWTSYQWYPLV